MSDSEVATLLDEGDRVQVGTHNPDGTIHLVPMSYVMFEARMTLWTDPTSRKVANLRADPAITCLVELGDDFGSFRAVQLIGTATISSDPDTSQAVGEALVARTVGALSDDLVAYVAGLAAQRVAVTVEPVRVVSWDHRKLAGARPDQVGS